MSIKQNLQNLIQVFRPHAGERFSFKAESPELRKFIGKTINIPGVNKTVTIQTIVGNKEKPAFYEINGKYMMNILRFHAQILGDTSITEEQFLAFENIEMEVEQIPEKKTPGMM